MPGTPFPSLRATIVLALALSIAGCASLRTDSAGRPELRARLDAMLRAREADGFSGAVMVARDGELVLSAGYGLADRARRRAATGRTPFQIASVSKPFTAAAILKLQSEGKLRLSDSIARHLPGVPADKRAITIRHLLTHTSGLPRRVGACSAASAALGRDDYVRHVLAAHLRSPPGKAFLYSNDGYGLLGAIIDRVADGDYESYLRTRLFEPAGMTRTGLTPPPRALADAAIGHDRQRIFLGNLDPAFRNASGPAWCNRASGGLLSTAEDMYRWYLTLRGNDLLSRHEKTAMWTPYVRESPRSGAFHGYGWTLRETRHGTLAFHDGSLSGYYTAELWWYLDEDLAFFVVANTAGHPAQDVGSRVARIALAFD